MLYKEFNAEGDLKKFIQRFWVLEHNYLEEFHSKEHLWANTNAELIFSFGNPYYLKTKSGNKMLPQNFVMGPLKKNLTLYSDGFTGLVAVRFQNWGMYPFSLKPIKTLVDKIVMAEEVFGAKINKVGNRLEKKDADEKIQILKEYFRSEMSEHKNKDISSIPIISKIIKEKGIINISYLTREFSISPRRLQRVFKNEIGLSAKIFSRIIRFNYAKSLIEQNPEISLSQLTYQTGYSDQAHFTKNFRELFDISPANFQSKVKELKQHFDNGKMDVVFLQDK